MTSDVGISIKGLKQKNLLLLLKLIATQPGLSRIDLAKITHLTKMTVTNIISELLELSLCWTLCSLPVITAVPAAAALYHTCALCVRRGEDGAFGRFLRSFRQNLRQGCILSVPLVVLGLLAADR